LRSVVLSATDIRLVSGATGSRPSFGRYLGRGRFGLLMQERSCTVIP
jgi:hypothetical protein